MTFRPNPGWADAILTRNLEYIEGSLGEEFLPASKRVTWEEYGCGHFGCVYPTGIPGLVLKLTSDKTEAAFAAMSRALGARPDGMVRYEAVYDLGAQWENREVYALWREEAFRVGEIFLNRDAEVTLDTMGDVALRVRSRLDEENAARLLTLVGKRSAKKKSRKPEPPVDEEIGLAVARIAGALAEYKDLAKRLMDVDPKRREVYQAMLYYAQHGILLADVRGANMGLVDRDDERVWAVTDPGLMVPVRLNRLQVRVPRLGFPDDPAEIVAVPERLD